jgi:hypothetical protein
VHTDIGTILQFQTSVLPTVDTKLPEDFPVFPKLDPMHEQSFMVTAPEMETKEISNKNKSKVWTL